MGGGRGDRLVGCMAGGQAGLAHVRFLQHGKAAHVVGFVPGVRPRPGSSRPGAAAGASIGPSRSRAPPLLDIKKALF